MRCLTQSEEEEEEEEEEDEEEDDISGMETPSTATGISSVTSGTIVFIFTAWFQSDTRIILSDRLPLNPSGLSA